jgi:hypothetical protein
MDLQLTYVKTPDGRKRLTIPEDRRVAAIEFVRENAARPAAEIESVVQAGHDAMIHALDGVSEKQAAFKPGPDDWSILELMSHVVTTKRIVATLCANLGDGHLPPGFGPQFEEESAQDGVTVDRFATLAEARAAAERFHDELLSFVRGITDRTDTEIRFRHFVFGAFNACEWAVFQRLHDEDHRPQITQIQAAPGYPTSP